MAVQLSPGVNFSEIDLTTIIPAVSSTDAAFAGLFRWGPIDEIVLIKDASELVNRFGKPTNFNAETFFTAYNFLSYSNRIYISRAANTGGSTPNVSVTATSGSPNVTMTNTSGLVAGMYVAQSGNSSVVATGNSVYIQQVTNTTSIVLSHNALASNTVTLYFAHPETSYNALGMETGGVAANLVNQIVKNRAHYTAKDGTFDQDVIWLAKYPGEIGNSLRISVCDTPNSYSSNIASQASFQFSIGNNIIQTSYTGASNVNGLAVAASIVNGDQILAGNSSIGYQYLQVRQVGTSTNSTHLTVTITLEDVYRLHTDFTTNTIHRYWEFYNYVNGAPGTSDYVVVNGNSAAFDELHVVVVDDGGKISGTQGSILEVFKNVSRATDAKNNDNTGNYYKEVINQSSQYIWWANDRSTALSATSANIVTATSTLPGNYRLILGADGLDENNVTLGTVASAFDVFKSPENIDISLVLQGKPIGGNGQTWQLANYLIQNIAETRRDCIVLVSPDLTKVLNNTGNETIDLISWRNSVQSSSYAVLDSGYKYQYDRYNDIYRWVPLNGDVAGLCVRTDNERDAWWSPAGFNRGQIKNVVKLAFNPVLADRDLLYSNGINPVVTFTGQGTVLYGDKTLQAKPSAFDRINVRRLFIVLEKAISRAAKSYLFEFNDSFTRASFKNMVVPYLRTIQGRRGITDFYVVCDDTNNTAQIIDSNQFVGDIYIKPARAINFIQLNFVAVATGVQFSEVIGKF